MAAPTEVVPTEGLAPKAAGAPPSDLIGAEPKASGAPPASSSSAQPKASGAPAAASGSAKKPTSKDVVEGKFSTYARRWTKDAEGTDREFDPKVVEDIFKSLKASNFDSNQIKQLEYNSYMEHYLWPFFDSETSTSAHLMSIALLINEKVRDGSISAWESIAATGKDKFAGFFNRVLNMWKSGDMAFNEKPHVIQLWINCFQSLEQEFVRDCCLRLTGLQSWFHLNELHRNKLITGNKNLATFWKRVQKKYAEPKTELAKHERNFMAELLDEFLAAVEEYGEQQVVTPVNFLYIERAIELMIDLLDQLPTRRFFRPLLADKHFVVRCQSSKIVQLPEARLITQLLGILRYYENFEIDDSTAAPLSRREVTDRHYERLQLLQRVCFQEFPDQPALKAISMSNVSSLDTREALKQNFGNQSLEVLKTLCAKVCYLDVSKDPVLSAMEATAQAAQEAAEKAEAEKEAQEGRPKKKRKKKVKTEEEQRLRDLLVDIMITRLERPTMQKDDIERMPLYPTEELVWDPNQVPEENYTGDYSLALPKLNLQFLTIHDYLLRNFNLYRLESTYEIRGDLQDQIPRMKAVTDQDGATKFAGKARMCLPLGGLEVMNVARPKVGETVPGEVRAEIKFCLTGMQPLVREEWDQLREHDVIFLLRIDAPEVQYDGKVADLSVEEFPEKFGVIALRGAEITELLDEEGNVISDPNPAERKTPVGDNRVARVLLDPAQYHADLEATADGKTDIYGSLNLIMRRKPKENNFKAILHTIRSLMSSEDTVVPSWLHDLFLGYGDPGAAQYWKMPTALTKVDFRDTFIDQDHILESFPDAEDIDIPDDLERPFRLEFEQVAKGENGKRPAEKIVASAYRLPNMGPYPECKPNVNKVRFTPVQVEAIRSGVNPGLTMVVGPPGTGKTDTAVQVVNLLFHNFPDQKIVLVAHSNQALNDLFEKIIALDIPERYLLRMGRGIKDLDSRIDFSKWGRVNHMLTRRMELLSKVERLAETFGVNGMDAAYTCENAQHFYLHHVQFRWAEFQRKLAIAGKDGANIDKVLERPKKATEPVEPKQKRRRINEDGEEVEDEEAPAEEAAPAPSEAKPEEEFEELKQAREFLKKGMRTVISILFPFTEFFADAPQPLFTSQSYEADLVVAEGCFRYLAQMFKEIEECHAFELLRNSRDRGNYLITTHARIIAMTCTHAALTRSSLVDLNFKYDNLIMEESAQILEVETFIPMLLQQSEQGASRLKRVMFIGDHHQLPPVVKNRAFQKYGHLDQSLYARFVRLKTPTVDLNLQGRARPAIADLYSWRYKSLNNLSNVLTEKRYRAANVGLTYEYQFIDVEDFEGKGESQPSPHFYQNLGEAEYCVALFMYMRLLGYPAEKISILSTYNGQKALIRDVIRQRCAWNPLFGEPSKVTTVDRFQGQQNDYIIVSLCRTAHIGHIRDVRRLVVTMSRARFGLYVFGRFGLFENCFELAPVFSRFAQRPRQLSLQLGETEATERLVGEEGKPTLSKDLPHMWQLLQDRMKSQFQAAATTVTSGQGAAGGEGPAPQ